MNITPTNSVSFSGRWSSVSSQCQTRSGRAYTKITHFYTPDAGESWADINGALIVKNRELGVVWKILKCGNERFKNVIHINSPRVPNLKAFVPASVRSFNPGRMKIRKKGDLTIIS